MKGVPLKIYTYVTFSFMFYPFEVRTYVLHALAGNRSVEAREEPHMDKLHACSFTRNVIARE